MTYGCVETFHHSQIIVTVLCGPLRNKLAVDNSGSIEKNDQYCLDTRFYNLTFFVPRHSRFCRFASWSNLQHQLSSSVTILIHTSRSWSTNTMKLHQHSTRCSLSSAVEECGTNLEQIFLSYKSLSKICLAAFLPTPRLSSSSLIVIRLSCITMARVFFPHLNCNEQKFAGLNEDHPPTIPCLLYQTRTIGILVHNSVFIVHIFQVLGHLHGNFPRLKVTFDHGTLFHVETFDTWKKQTLNSTAIKWQLIKLQRRACACSNEHICGQNRTLFC